MNKLKDEIKTLADMELMNIKLNIKDDVKALIAKHGKEEVKQAMKTTGFYVILKKYL